MAIGLTAAVIGAGCGAKNSGHALENTSSVSGRNNAAVTVKLGAVTAMNVFDVSGGVYTPIHRQEGTISINSIVAKANSYPLQVDSYTDDSVDGARTEIGIGDLTVSNLPCSITKKSATPGVRWPAFVTFSDKKPATIAEDAGSDNFSPQSIGSAIAQIGQISNAQLAVEGQSFHMTIYEPTIADPSAGLSEVDVQKDVTGMSTLVQTIDDFCRRRST